MLIPTGTRRWRCKKCGRHYTEGVKAGNCTCPPLPDDQIERLAICLKETFELPETLNEIAILLGRSKYKKPPVLDDDKHELF